MAAALVDVIKTADRRRGLATLTLAFAADPIMRWAWSDPYQYATYWPRVAEAYGGRAFDDGTAHGLEDCLAVALWLAPGLGPDEDAFMRLLGESIAGRVLSELTSVVEQMDQLHPSADHWYLPLTGVDPVAQGQRRGSTLLQHGLAICDRDALPAYLEATSPRNRTLYERHGFNVVGVIQAGSSPPMWAMLRAPASEADSRAAGVR